MTGFNSVIKDAYCTYIVQLLLKCKNDIELNIALDRLSELEFDDVIIGDNDFKEVISYVHKRRLYNQNLIKDRPQIDFKTIAKVAAKSIF